MLVGIGDIQYILENDLHRAFRFWHFLRLTYCMSQSGFFKLTVETRKLICESLGISRATMYRLLSQCIDQGWIEKVEDEYHIISRYKCFPRNGRAAICVDMEKIKKGQRAFKAYLLSCVVAKRITYGYKFAKFLFSGSQKLNAVREMGFSQPFAVSVMNQHTGLSSSECTRLKKIASAHNWLSIETNRVNERFKHFPMSQKQAFKEGYPELSHRIRRSKFWPYTDIHLIDPDLITINSLEIVRFSNLNSGIVAPKMRMERD